jgi:hypothetical protein
VEEFDLSFKCTSESLVVTYEWFSSLRAVKLTEFCHNILEPVLGWPSKKESKTTLMSKIW